MNHIEIAFEWLPATTLRASALAVAILGLQFLLRRWLSAGWRHALWLPMVAVLILPALRTSAFVGKLTGAGLLTRMLVIGVHP